MSEQTIKSQVVGFQGWPLRVEITECVCPITIKQILVGASISAEGIEDHIERPEVTINVDQAEWLICALEKAIEAAR
jgi:hypothetical protein